MADRNVDLTGYTVITSGDDFTRAIYDSLKNYYTMNTLLISTFDILQPEDYYVDLIPALSGLEFHNVIVYNNVIVMQCDYTCANSSLIGEEIAVEYAIVNGTEELLTESEKELYDRVMEIAASLKVTNGQSGSGNDGNGQGINEYETVKNIHDYLVRHIVYTYSEDIGTGTDLVADQKLRSALFLNKCVCAGYAKSFYFLCRACGLDVLYISGDATNSSGITDGHAWNKVKIDGKWYAVDVTWDDPLIYDPVTGTSYDGGDKVEYNYFLITDADMDIDHDWDDDPFPDAVSTDLGIVYQLAG